MPEGLINYTTSSLYAANVAGKNEHWNWKHLLRPRTLIYFGLWTAVGIAMLVTLINRTQLDVNVVPDRNPLYVTLSDGSIRNGYTVKILNKRQEQRTFRLAVAGLPGATMEMVGEDGVKGASIDISVEPDKLRAVKIYVATADATVISRERSDFHFDVEELNPKDGRASESVSYRAIFHAQAKKE
jgi:polyferredoxin